MRLFFIFFEFAIGVLLALFFITQLIVPALRGTKLFPIFRTETDLKAKIVAARQKLREGQFRNLLQKLQRNRKE